jgi:hypothetical protein
LADLALSSLSNFVLFLAALDLLELGEIDLPKSVKSLLAGSFPVALMSHIIFNFNGKTDLLSILFNGKIDLLPILQAVDTALSFTAPVFVGLTLVAKMIVNKQHALAAFTGLAFALWSLPELGYWDGLTVASQLAMGLGGILVAFSTTIAAYRHVV